MMRQMKIKMNRETIIYMCTLAFVTLSTLGGYAAEVNKEVEVTRAYVPEIKMATKLHLTPDTSDDNYIEPDIDYSITPISIETILESELYKPVKITLEEYEPTKRFYTKVGLGAPFQSVVDIYATPIRSSSGYIVGYANQVGRFADIENDYGNKIDATQNHMRAGVAAGRYISYRTLEGAINYNNDRWSRYATNGLMDLNPLYQSVDFKGRFGDNFRDLNRFNFLLEATAEQFWSRSNYDNFDFGVSTLVGGSLFGGVVVAGVGYNNITGSSDYLNSTLDLGVQYIVRNDSRWSMMFGFKYYRDMVSYDKYMATEVALSNDDGSNIYDRSDRNVGDYIIPDVEISYKLKSDRVVGYMKSTGELLHRDFATLSEENPYLAAGLFAVESGVVYDVSFGVKGRSRKGYFGYNIFAEYNANKNNLYWALYEASNNISYINNYFIATYSTQHNVDLNLEMEYQPMSNLLFGADLKLSCYTNNGTQPFEDGNATIELDIDANYSVGSWVFGLNGELLSSRDYSVVRYSILYAERVPTTFDLGLSADYTLKNSMKLFAEANNILNNNIYRWVGYREYGVNAMVGVKVQF